MGGTWRPCLDLISQPSSRLFFFPGRRVALVSEPPSVLRLLFYKGSVIRAPFLAPSPPLLQGAQATPLPPAQTAFGLGGWRAKLDSPMAPTTQLLLYSIASPNSGHETSVPQSNTLVYCAFD